MRRIDKALSSADNSHRRESYIGPLASTSVGGHFANVNNLYGSQVKGKSLMPYGISSRAMSGMKSQAIVNDNSDNSIIGVYDPQRPQVGVGEICLYSVGGCSIYLSAGGAVSIESGGCSLDVESDKITMNKGNAEITIKSGDIDIVSNNTSIHINSDGVSIETSNNINMKSTGDTNIQSDGKISLVSSGDTEVECAKLKIKGDTEITGELKVNEQTMIVP